MNLHSREIEMRVQICYNYFQERRSCVWIMILNGYALICHYII